MRMSELTAVAPLTLSEESPAMSFAAALFSSPAYLSVAWVPRISRRG